MLAWTRAVRFAAGSCSYEQISLRSTKPVKTRILLLTPSQAVADGIDSCVRGNDFLNRCYEVTWIASNWLKQLERGRPYALCALDYEILPLFQEFLPQIPTVVLTKSWEVGLQSIKEGANDYWNLNALDPHTIERSLRLAIPTTASVELQQCQDQQAFYRDFFCNSVDGLFSLDILFDSKLVYRAVNDTYAQLLGTKPENIVGKEITAVLPKIEQRTYSKCLYSRTPISYEHTVQIQGKAQIWLVTLAPIRDGEGLPRQVQGSARNITSEKQAITQQIRQTRYRHLLRAIALKIRQSLDLSSIINIAVRELQKTLNCDRVVMLKFGKNAGEIIEEAVTEDFASMLGITLSDRYYQQIPLAKNPTEGYFYAWQDINCEAISPDYRQLLQQYQVKANLVIPIIRRTHNSDSVSHSVYLWGLLCVHQCRNPREWTRDEIELLQQLGEQLNIALSQAELLASEVKQKQELTRSNAELEQFAYITSHDLQAPLQTISNYAQLLQHRYQAKLDAKGDKYINYIVDAVDRMRNQIEDLLEYSRVNRQQNTFRLTDFRLILQQASANLASEIESTQAEISIPSELPSLVVDSFQFVTLFQNLIGNSLKYRSNQTPKIVIKAELKGDRWLFSITDNGIGIEPKYHERIFQIFQRLHTQEEYPGTGIGLAICQKIVQRHGGQIWLESANNLQTTFFFTVPSSYQFEDKSS